MFEVKPGRSQSSGPQRAAPIDPESSLFGHSMVAIHTVL